MGDRPCPGGHSHHTHCHRHPPIQEVSATPGSVGQNLPLASLLLSGAVLSGPSQPGPWVQWEARMDRNSGSVCAHLQVCLYEEGLTPGMSVCFCACECVCLIYSFQEPLLPGLLL